MTSNTKVTNQTTSERSGATRFFIGLMKVLLLLLFIAAGVFLGYLGWQQITYINTINDVQSQRISRIDQEMVLANDVENQIRASNQTLDADLEALQDQLDELAAANAQMQTTLDEQAAVIDGMTTTGSDLNATIDDLQTGSEALGSALLALQQDITASNADIDSIGATVDDLVNSVAAIDTQIEDLGESVEAAPVVGDEEGEDGTPPTVVVSSSGDFAVWRLWGLVMRTKIHLAENDIEAANDALAIALEAATNLAEDGDDTLTAVQEQLESAAEDLLSKPAAANRTLDETLDALDELLIN